MKSPNKTVFSFFINQLHYRSGLGCCLAFILMLMTSGNSVLKAQESLQLGVDSIYDADQEGKLKIQGILQLISRQDTSEYTPELGFAYHRLGLLFNKAQDYQNAIDVTLIAVRIRETLADAAYKDLDNSLFNVFVYLRKLDRADEGEQYLKQILKNNAGNKFQYSALNSLAMLKAEKGDFFEALEYLDTLIQTIDREKFESIFIAGIKNGIWIYSEMPHPERYFPEIKKLEGCLKSYELGDEEMVNAYTNLGAIYSQMKENEKAIEYYVKALKFHRLNEDSIGLGEIYNNLGIEYSILDQKDKAGTYYQMGMQYANREVRAFIYDNQGFFLHPGDPRARLRLFQKAINTVLDKENEAIAIDFLPALSRIGASANRLDILFFLIDKATAWVDLFEQEHNPQYLVHAKETLYLSDQLVSMIRQDSDSEKSKLFWINHGVDSYVLATKVCFLLNEPEEAFYFMEKNKSLLLLENLTKANQTNTKMLSISSWEEAKGKYVSNHSNLVEFILNEKEGFGLFCTESFIRFFALSDVPVLIANITRLKEMVERPFSSKKEFDEFDQLSYAVFKQLFPFTEAASQLADKQLRVIPDYELHNLPFELLTTQVSAQSFEKNYLINTTEVSYLHSCTVNQRIEQLERENEYGMIGFVPTIFNDATLADLQWSEVEMKEIAAFFPSQLVLREQATKASFINSLDLYRIVHINSHAGYTQNSTPWLSFYDQKVSLEELTTYSNHSNLVILDACKSALGEQKLGEGIMSLARAFFYGGSASVIASQWQVNEKSSGEIFKAFYKNLKAGESKSQALHHAKLTYLAANQLSQLSPYYWASFTLTGDTGQVTIGKDNYWIKVITAVLALLLLAFFGKILFFSK